MATKIHGDLSSTPSACESSSQRRRWLSRLAALGKRASGVQCSYREPELVRVVASFHTPLVPTCSSVGRRPPSFIDGASSTRTQDPDPVAGHPVTLEAFAYSSSAGRAEINRHAPFAEIEPRPSYSGRLAPQPCIATRSYSSPFASHHQHVVLCSGSGSGGFGRRRSGWFPQGH